MSYIHLVDDPKGKQGTWFGNGDPPVISPKLRKSTTLVESWQAGLQGRRATNPEGGDIVMQLNRWGELVSRRTHLVYARGDREGFCSVNCLCGICGGYAYFWGWKLDLKLESCVALWRRQCFFVTTSPCWGRSSPLATGLGTKLARGLIYYPSRRPRARRFKYGFRWETQDGNWIPGRGGLWVSLAQFLPDG